MGLVLAVLGTLGGTLGGAWVQRKAAVLQVREEAGAQGRARGCGGTACGVRPGAGPLR